MGYIIEFCGVPGSGKTTLSNTCLNLLKTQGLSVLSREEMKNAALSKRDFGRLANFLKFVFPSWKQSFLAESHSLKDWHRFAIKYPHFVSYLHEFLARGDLDSSWRSMVLYAFMTSSFERFLASEITSAAIIDEGLCQRCHTLFGYDVNITNDDVIKYANYLPLPDLLIFVQINPNECLERIEKRNRFPMFYKNDNRLFNLKCLSQGNLVLKDLFLELEKKNANVIRIDGENNIEKNVNILTNFIRQELLKNQ